MDNKNRHNTQHRRPFSKRVGSCEVNPVWAVQYKGAKYFVHWNNKRQHFAIYSETTCKFIHRIPGDEAEFGKETAMDWIEENC